MGCSHEGHRGPRRACRGGVPQGHATHSPCHWLFPLLWWQGGEGDESQKWARWSLTSRALGSWAKGPLKGGVKAGAWSLPLALGLAEGSFSRRKHGMSRVPDDSQGLAARPHPALETILTSKVVAGE